MWELKSGDYSFTKPAEMFEILNDHFTSVGPNLASTLPSGNTSFDSYIKPVSTTFNLQHTSATEVLKLLGKLSPHKATGLDNISCWLLKEAGPIIATSLSLNVTKTEYMFLTTTVKLSNLGRDFPVKIGNNHVKRVQATKNLGIHSDENLKWNAHVDKLCSKINRSISGLKQARDYVPLDVLNSIYKSLIQPVFDYCDVVWDNLDQGRATRYKTFRI